MLKLRINPIVAKDLKNIRDYIAAVSYTHLDVYKRQVHAMAEQLMKLLKKDLVVYLSDGNTLKEPTAVSYTHLDVYKRQPGERSRLEQRKGLYSGQSSVQLRPKAHLR